MSARMRHVVAVGGSAAVIGLLGAAAAALGAKPTATGKKDSGTIHTGEIRAVGTTLYQAGSVSDTLFGSAAVTFSTTLTLTKPGTVHFTTNTAKLWTPTGTLAGTVSADIQLVSATRSIVANGKLTLTGRSGSEQGQTLVGTFTGSGDPTTTRYLFTYTATYR